MSGSPELLPFRSGVSLARSASFPMRQLTLRRWAAGDYGHDMGNALFSSSVRSVFPLPCILSPCATGRNYGIILTRPFSIQLSHSQNLACFVYVVKEYSLPFRLATLVRCSAWCGYLTPYLIAPKRTDIFCFSQLQKNVSNKKSCLFLAFAVFAVCFLNLFFYIFFYSFFFVLVCRSVWLSSTLNYKTIFCNCKTFEKKFF